MTYLSDSIVKLFCVVVYGAVRIISQISHSVGLFPMLQNVLAFNHPVIVNDFMAGLTWGRNFYPHTHPIPIPMGIPMGIPILTAELLYGAARIGVVRGLNASTSHARTVVRESCKGDDESQWERGKFDPRHPKTP